MTVPGPEAGVHTALEWAAEVAGLRSSARRAGRGFRHTTASCRDRPWRVFRAVGCADAQSSPSHGKAARCSTAI